MASFTTPKLYYKAPLPRTREELSSRLHELNEIKRAAEQEIKDLTGSEYFKEFSSIRHTCLRCGHVWEPLLPTRPRSCPTCRSVGWDKPRKFRRVKVDEPIVQAARVQEIVVAPTPFIERDLRDPDGIIRLTPPPVPPGTVRPSVPPPLNLRESLSSLSHLSKVAEEPQPEGYGQSRQSVQPVQQVELDSQDDSESDRLDQLEQEALEAINGPTQPRPTET